jgi:hypothetical protein
MENFDLLQQILAHGKTDHAEEILDVKYHFPNNEVTISHSIGPIGPRTRIVTFAAVEGGHNVTYHEVTHGVPQMPIGSVTDTSNAVEVSRLIPRIWKHLRAQ